MSKSRSQLVDYLNKIDVSGKSVVDIGAGPKEKWVINFVKGEPLEYKTCDINKEFGCDYVADLNEVFKLPKRFDYVFCIETLEHVWDSFTAIENLIECAKEKIYISVPFINPIHDEWDYLRYTGEWFKKAFAYFKVNNVSIYPRIATEGLVDLLNFYKKEGLRMSKLRLKRGEGNKIRDIGYFIEAVL